MERMQGDAAAAPVYQVVELPAIPKQEQKGFLHRNLGFSVVQTVSSTATAKSQLIQGQNKDAIQQIFDRVLGDNRFFGMFGNEVIEGETEREVNELRALRNATRVNSQSPFSTYTKIGNEIFALYKPKGHLGIGHPMLYVSVPFVDAENPAVTHQRVEKAIAAQELHKIVEQHPGRKDIVPFYQRGDSFYALNPQTGEVLGPERTVEALKAKFSPAKKAPAAAAVFVRRPAVEQQAQAPAPAVVQQQQQQAPAAAVFVRRPAVEQQAQAPAPAVVQQQQQAPAAAVFVRRPAVEQQAQAPAPAVVQQQQQQAPAAAVFVRRPAVEQQAQDPAAAVFVRRPAVVQPQAAPAPVQRNAARQAPPFQPGDGQV